jgi:hypothetical protein
LDEIRIPGEDFWMVRRIRTWRPSHTTVAAYMALFVALGGTSYAAVKLPRNSVGGKQIKPNAVSSSKVKNGSLRLADFGAGQVPAGPRGADGAPGTPGADGSPGADGTAAAFARVGAAGLLDGGSPPQNKNVVQANIQHDAVAGSTTTGPGVYCIGGLSFAPRSAMVTPDSAGALGTTNVIASVAVQRGNTLGNCDAGHQQARVSILAVDQTNAPTLTDHGFYIWFEK